MRVINTRTLELHESINRPYAILSHTWGQGEVTLQQYREWRSAHAEYFARNVEAVADGSVEPAEITMLNRINRGDSPAESERTRYQGMTKILRSAERALLDGYEYIWVDTCCIDKTSSAELQEAINSMFEWYKFAEVCYAYLSDVDGSTPGQDDLTSSRWFSRGWTLQELLAPREVLFFDMNWKKLGRKDDFLDVLTKRTGIHRYFLYTGAERLEEASVATRMSWAAGRETKRVEDKAYCLLGLFGIHMPMLYGEGALAFERLQLEIMKSSDDASILAWDYSGTWIPVSHDRSARFERTGRDGWTHHGGLMATSPDQYAKCHHIRNIKTVGYETMTSFSMSQHGLELETPIVHDRLVPNLFYAILSCGRLDHDIPGYHYLVIPLMTADQKGVANPLEGVAAVRAAWMTPMTVTGRFRAMEMFSKIRIVDKTKWHTKARRGLQFNCHHFDSEWELVGMYPLGPDVLRIRPKDGLYEEGRSVPMADFPKDGQTRRLFCWKNKYKDLRIIVSIHLADAQNSRCAALDYSNPRKGWCWIARLEEPFTLECAQRLCPDTRHYNHQLKRLQLFELQSFDGRPIPYHEILSPFQTNEYELLLGARDPMAEDGNERANVNQLM